MDKLHLEGVGCQGMRTVIEKMKKRKKYSSEMNVGS